MAKNKNFDTGYLIRISFCILFFLISILYFFYFCGVLSDNFLLIFSPSKKEFLIWFINIVISSVLTIAMIGVTAILVRPAWILMVVYFLSTFLYLFFVGVNLVTLIVSVLFGLFLVLFLKIEIGLINNQIKASLHPFNEKRTMISIVLAVFVAVSFGVGFYNDSVSRNYIIPPEAKTVYGDWILNTVETQASEKNVDSITKDTMIAEAKKNIEDSFKKIEESLNPVKNYVSVLIGAMLFFILQIVYVIIGLLAVVFIIPIFWLLKISGFINLKSEKVEITRFSLMS